MDEPIVLGGLGEMNSNGGTQFYQQDRVYSSDGFALCHPANIPGGSYKYLVVEDGYKTTRNLESEQFSTSHHI